MGLFQDTRPGQAASEGEVGGEYGVALRHRAGTVAEPGASRLRGQGGLACHTQRDKEILLRAGADMVLLPFRDAVKEADRQLTEPQAA